MINTSANALQEYEQWHQHYNTALVQQEELKLMPWHLSVLEQMPASLAGRTVLEVGCGNGDFSNYLASNNDIQITGVDFSTQSIAVADKKKAHRNIGNATFAVADAQALPYADNSFDLVISCECLEHVPQPQKMIDELYRVVKKGGRVILTTENYSNAYAYYIPYLKWRGKKYDSGSTVQPIEHFFVYWNVKKKFRKAGFNALRTASRQFVFLLLPGTSPDRFTLQNTGSHFLKKLLKPIGRRFTYIAQK